MQRPWASVPHVGSKIGPRIMHFVEELLGDGSAVDNPTPVRLANHEAPIRSDFGNRKPGVGQIRNVLEAGIDEVSAGHLRAAFEQMAAHRPSAKTLPVVEPPAECMDHWS